MKQLHFLAIGGATRAASSTERALRKALGHAEARGARVTLLSGPAISFPPYAPENPARTPEAAAFVDAVRSADAIILGSPGYHGGVSGLVKNAIDYIEDTRGDSRCYIDGMPVGCIATAAGWQAAVATLAQLRSFVHALRGWPTPIGVAINTAGEGDAIEAQPASDQIAMMVAQQFSFLSR